MRDKLGLFFVVWLFVLMGALFAVSLKTLRAENQIKDFESMYYQCMKEKTAVIEYTSDCIIQKQDLPKGFDSHGWHPI